MLEILTTPELAEWFARLDDRTAEDVATYLDMVEELGVTRAPPASRESLLWYEHPSVAQFEDQPLAEMLDGWGSLRDYANRVLRTLESPRFTKRLEQLSGPRAERALGAVEEIRRAIDPRRLWRIELHRPAGGGHGAASRPDPREAVRGAFLAALEAAGLEPVDVPAHGSHLREICQRSPQGRTFRLLYGVSVEREKALFVLGESLDRAFYGDSVRRAEATWKRFLCGDLEVSEPAHHRR